MLCCVYLLLGIFASHAARAEGQGSQEEFVLTPERELLAKYLLQKILWKAPGDHKVERRQNEGSEEADIVYPQYPEDEEGEQFPGEQSQVVPTFVKAPSSLTIGEKDKNIEKTKKEHGHHKGSRFSMPLVPLGDRKYYIGTFFKANWHKAAQYCRFHGLHLASIDTEEVQESLEYHIESLGLGEEHFWTSGSDLAEEGEYYWMSTGRPVKYSNWNAGEPNNFKYDNGEEEHCLELWNRDGKGLGWNDTPCSFATYFICQL